MKTLHGSRLRISLSIATALQLLFTSAGAFAGDVTADNVTVNKDLKVQAGSGSAPTNGLIAYYSFSTNTSPVPDDSGNNHTGTVSGATWVTNGITGGAYSFDGTNDYIDLGNDTSLRLATYFTISVWTYEVGPGSGGGGNSIVSKWTDAGTREYRLQRWWGSGSGIFTVNYYEHCDIPAGAVVSNQWTHIVGLGDGTNLNVYVNGVLQGTCNYTKPINAGNNRVYIGMQQANLRNFNGLIDEVRIYNRGLTPSEIVGLYRNDAKLTAGTVYFQGGVTFMKPLGDVSMGGYTNQP